jgi:hypothetical protein
VEVVIDERFGIREVAERMFGRYKPKQLRIDEKKRRVEIDKSVIKLSELMELLYCEKGKLIQDFSIDEPKFEDVYLKVTADQNMEHDDSGT